MTVSIQQHICAISAHSEAPSMGTLNEVKVCQETSAGSLSLVEGRRGRRERGRGEEEEKGEGDADSTAKSKKKVSKERTKRTRMTTMNPCAGECCFPLEKDSSHERKK